LAPSGGEIVIGRDTRLSGPMLEGALVAGLCSAGVHVRLAGIVPTPGVAFLTLDEKARAGTVISASHNPVPDNGIKFFSDEGLKISEDVEDAIERLMSASNGDFPVGVGVGSADFIVDGVDRYVDHLANSIEVSLDGLKVVLDCAFGAAWDIAPRAFEAEGAETIAMNAAPDGSRINVGCGSTSTESLARRVVSEDAHLGLAFDGDADRVLAVDERGEVVDGDGILGLIAFDLNDAGRLDGNAVVATVMSNLGFKRALAERGIDVVVAPVGDKNVADAMAEHGATLGGEQSGHVIIGGLSTTGDGVLTGLRIASLVATSGRPLSDLADFFEPFPQVLVNVPVAHKEHLDSARELWDEVHGAEESLGDDGRVLLRASGTEPLVRVMVEAEEESTARATADRLVESVRTHLG